jgi:Ca2+-binding RTX toxin-like protein
VGGSGNDVLAGSYGTTSQPEVDTLTGGAGSDTFTYIYIASIGSAEYALITDFNTTEDVIELSVGQYVLGSAPVGGVSGSSIYLDTDSSGSVSSGDDLITVVQGVTGLDLSADYIVYI